MAKAKKSNKLKKPMTFSMGAVMLFATIFGVVGAYAIWKTFAAPAPSGPSTITLDQKDPYLGSSVTFTVTYPKLKGNPTPRIAVRCFQDVDGDGTVDTKDWNPVTNKDFVYGEAGSADQAKQQALTGNPGFLLGGGGSEWKTRGGAATCNAELFYFTYKGGQQYYHFLAVGPDWAAGAAR